MAESIFVVAVDLGVEPALGVVCWDAHYLQILLL